MVSCFMVRPCLSLVTDASATRVVHSILVFLFRYFNGYPVLVAVIHDQHRHHVVDGTMLPFRLRAQRLFQFRFDAKSQRGGLGGGYGFPLVW